MKIETVGKVSINLAERALETVVNTTSYRKGAEETLYLAKLFNVKKALLKAKLPSCGNKEIYDGTFTKNKIKGMGITAKLLKENGIEILSEEEI